MRRNEVLSVASVVLLAAGCVDETALEYEGELESSSSALTGVATQESGCTPEVWKNVQLSHALTRVAVNSPAFAECIASSLSISSYTKFAIGFELLPYLACKNDPRPLTAAAIVASAKSASRPRITCEGGWGGSAFVRLDDGVEEINVGVDGLRYGNRPCDLNPDGTEPCVPAGFYSAAANSLAHESMHQHGYDHVSDALNNHNGANVGDLIGVDDAGVTHRFTLDDFCGIQPAYTKHDPNLPPADWTDTPTPGPHPTYGTGMPYIVGGCVETVLNNSHASGHMYDGCGSEFAGLHLLRSITSSTSAMDCVADPLVGAEPPHQPIAPNPTACHLMGCEGKAPVANCDDVHHAEVILEVRTGSGPWHVADASMTNTQARFCTETLYGKACSAAVSWSTLTVARPSDALCNGLNANDIRGTPIPKWQQQPYAQTTAGTTLGTTTLGTSVITRGTSVIAKQPAATTLVR